MKVALVHDYIKEYGGAERVLETLHEIFPQAPVYTSVYLPQFLGPHRARFDKWDIRTSVFQNFPLIGKLISPLRLFSSLMFENFDFSNFDLIIVSATGAYFPNLLVKNPQTIQICYCHTPPRYLYGYATSRNWRKNAVGKFCGEIINHKLRQVDYLAGQRPDYFIANSREVQRRINKFYRREATVIYPPVNTVSTPIISGSSIKYHVSGMNNKSYYLAGGRLARAKRIDLVIKACNQLKVPLKIFGKSFADYGDELNKLAGPTVEFLGEVCEDKLDKLYSQAKALIYTSSEEDFGIMPVEAMAHGTPVVAIREGGIKETVIDGKTGVLFDKPDVADITEAIKKLEKNKIKFEDCVSQAKKFSKERFKKEIQEFISSKMK